MRVALLVAGVGLFVGSFVAFGSRTQVLSAAECLAVTGTVNDKICGTAGTCTAYNHTQGMPNCNLCPQYAYGCQRCDRQVSTDWMTCQVHTGSNCTPNTGSTECGTVGQGYCNGCNCEDIVFYGEPDCLDSPICGG